MLLGLEKWQPRVPSFRNWDPISEMADLRRMTDQVFGEFFGRTPFEMASVEGLWSPMVDIYETKDGLRLTAELPGVKQEDIHLSIEGNTLTLKGERKHEMDVKEVQYYRIERSYGNFQRSILLPSMVDGSQVKAT